MFWKRRPMPRDWHGIKPDSDNCIKSLKDSLKGLVWADDSQVCDERIFKFVAAGDEQPHVDVMVETLSHE